MSSVEDAEHAAGALETYCARCPFTPRGILLSDNAKSFLSETFIKTCRSLDFVQRTIRTAHPWSNGKCEALNRTLKYQCFPAIAGNITGWEDMCHLVTLWMEFYNGTRAHTGHVNRGLPPLAFLSLYNSTPGDHLDRLLAFGIVEESQKWHLRPMGSPDRGRLGDALPGEGPCDGYPSELPYALVMEKVNDGTYQNVFADHTHQVTDPPPPLASAAHVTLSK